MADHRVTDLSYGHLGKANYDHVDKSWNFSVNTEHELRVRLVQELKKCISLSSISDESETNVTSSVLAQVQMRRLFKSNPEMLPASKDISTFLKTSSMDSSFAFHEGCILTAAHAKDSRRISGSHRPQILAFPSGESGHILHLIRLKPETRGWTDKRDARLEVLESSGAAEHGYWIGTGGAIRQIVSAEDEERRIGPWLAVRQDTLITVFQPVYGQLLHATTTPIMNANTSRSTLLHPNPVVNLTPDRTASRSHVDFSFNPFYARQFAVVDESGRWSIWNVENAGGKKNRNVLMLGRNGDISEDQLKDDVHSKGSDPGHADGWHKVLWICNVNTIVVCDRRRLAVFDVGSVPERLNVPNFLPVKGNDWIIDVMRSPTNINHIFVLTSSRIYWINIVPAGRLEKTKVLLSYRHYRDENDEAMRLTVVVDRHIFLTITSSKSPLINIYSFLSESSYEVSCQSCITLQYLDDNGTQDNYFRGTCLLPCTYEPGPARHDLGEEEKIVLFQLWGLTNSGVFTALCVAQHLRFGEEEYQIKVPDKKRAHKFRKRGRANIVDQFIVPDVLERSEEFTIAHKNVQSPKVNPNDDLRFGIDWTLPFEHAFAATHTIPDILVNVGSVQELLKRVSEKISKGLEEDTLPMDTCASMAQLDISSGELDEGSSALWDFLSFLNLNAGDPESASTLVLSDLTRCPRTQDLFGSDTADVSLLKVHEQLVKYWVTDLPLHVTPQARLAKFKIIRQLGVELALNSVGISLQKKASIATNVLVVHPKEKDRVNATTTRESSPDLFSSQPQQIFGQDIYSSLPTPSQTPSMYSQATSATSESNEADELKEDQAISRLRQYAVSIGFREDSGKSPLLAHWPSQPGSDPSSYSYEIVQQRAAAEENGYENERRNKKEEKWRRRRAEKFLRLERERSRITALRTGPMSQPIVSMSQPIEARELSAANQPEVDDNALRPASPRSRVTSQPKKSKGRPRLHPSTARVEAMSSADELRLGVLSQLDRASVGSMSQPSGARVLSRLSPKPSAESQPQAHDYAFSSQTGIYEVPMTQSSVGIHGSRLVAGRKKLKTIRKAGFR